MHLFIQHVNVILLALSQLSQARPAHSKRDVSIKELEGLTSVPLDSNLIENQNDPPDKYFHEFTVNVHYDGRFATLSLPEAERIIHLRHLIRTYLSTMEEIGVDTWLMHGSLLGWYWNQRIMPWDTDIDVQVSEPGIRYLAHYYNMTVHHFPDIDIDVPDRTSSSPPPSSPESTISDHEIPDPKPRKRGPRRRRDTQGKKYLLEINPHYANASHLDTHNLIDARWIDTSTGLFIDITALRRDYTSTTISSSSPSSVENMLTTKARHTYLSTSIYPLRRTTFESAPAKIPYSYVEILRGEYGDRALTRTRFLGHRFDGERKEWVVLLPRS